MGNILVTQWDSPAGRLLLGSHGDELVLCDWCGRKDRERVDRRIARMLGADYLEGRSEIIDAAICELQEYFNRERLAFDLPLKICGTEFQRAVWKALTTIPYGEKVTYTDIARMAGKPRAVRAVAAAVGANPLSIIIPCHRVIGADGSLTGYAGSLPTKSYLLSLERGQ